MRTAAWLQAEARRRRAASRAVALERQASRSRLTDEGFHVVTGLSLSSALDELDAANRGLTPVTHERRRTA